MHTLMSTGGTSCGSTSALCCLDILNFDLVELLMYVKVKKNPTILLSMYDNAMKRT